MGNRQTAIANLKKKGADANPNGRPKKEWTIKSLIKQAMEEESETGVPYKKLVYQKLVQKAAEGDVAAVRELNNRLEGMSRQSVDLKGKLETFSGADYIGEHNSKVDASPDGDSTGQS